MRIVALTLLIALLTACSRTPNLTKEEWNERAFAAIGAKQWAEAVKAGEQAVKLDPSYPQARFNLGLALFRSERFADAEAHLKTAYELNRQQVEPGWFLALTLEKLGETGAALMLFQDLADRFPDDADVKGELARLEGGPVAWSRMVDGTDSVFLGERLVALTGDRLAVDAYDAGGRLVWSHTAGARVERLLVSPGGTHVLLVMKDDSLLIDVASGSQFVRVPVSMPADSGGFVWQGDRLYFGEDRWGPTATGGGRYLSTSWRMFRTGASGPWEAVPLVGSIALGQSITLSADGRTALVTPRTGPADELFLDGKPLRLVATSPAAIGRDGQVYLVGTDGVITRLGPEGKPVWDRAGVPGMTNLQLWPQGQEDWLVVSGPGEKGWAVLKGRDPAVFKGEGRLVALTDRHLIEETGGSTWVLDRSGTLVARYRFTGASVTPDGRWLYSYKRDGIQAFRLP